MAQLFFTSTTQLLQDGAKLQTQVAADYVIEKLKMAVRIEFCLNTKSPGCQKSVSYHLFFL